MSDAGTTPTRADRPRGLMPFPGVDGLWVADLVAGRDTNWLDAWQAVHLRHFPEHGHVVAEIADEVRGRPLDPDTIAHVWLAFDAESVDPVGEFIWHTNLRRRVVLMHFSAVDSDVRAGLSPSWLPALIDATLACGQQEGLAAGRNIRGQITEVSPAHARAWPRYGMHALPIDYLEPTGGRHWRDRGPEPEFFEITPIFRTTRAAADEEYADVAADALSAFLIDHYRLPADHPQVVRVLTQVRSATPPAAAPRL